MAEPAPYVTAYAREIGTPMAIISPQAAVFSLLAFEAAPDRLNALFGRLEAQDMQDLTSRGVPDEIFPISGNALPACMRCIRRRCRERSLQSEYYMLTVYQ
jgi:hypothetical protein